MAEIKRKWATVREVTEMFPISLGHMRYLLMNSKANGLEICVRRIGRKILINIDQFDAWIDAHKPTVK